MGRKRGKIPGFGHFRVTETPKHLVMKFEKKNPQHAANVDGNSNGEREVVLQHRKHQLSLQWLDGLAFMFEYGMGAQVRTNKKKALQHYTVALPASPLRFIILLYFSSLGT